MYLLNHNLDADLIITLELYHGTDNEVQLKPIFQTPSSLEAEWFKFNTSLEWIVFFRKDDNYLALIEVDMQADDYATAAGTK